MENLREFLERTDGFSGHSIYSDDVFTTHPNVEKKVNRFGGFKPFFGDTTVFLLGDDAMKRLGEIQDRLYEKAGCMLSDRLIKSTFHLTLHDLNNSPDEREIWADMEKSSVKAGEIIEKIQNEGGKIKLRMTYLFNMMNTSMVLGFAPVDDESCERLMGMYEAMQEARFLNYPLTPHVTVAYFKPGEYYGNDIARLKEAIAEINNERFEIELDVKKLVYQRFTDMNSYMTI